MTTGQIITSREEGQKALSGATQLFKNGAFSWWFNRSTGKTWMVTDSTDEYSVKERSGLPIYFQVSQEKIDDLKQQWLFDPIWDIETTEGFEFHWEELRAFRLEKEEEWTNMQIEGVRRLAYELGIPGNLRLAGYIMRLEQNLRAKTEEIDRRLDRMDGNQ